MNPVGWLGISEATGAKIVSWIGLAFRLAFFTHALSSVGVIKDVEQNLAKDTKPVLKIFKQIAGRDINYLADTLTNDLSDYLAKTDREMLEATAYMTLTFLLDIFLRAAIELENKRMCQSWIILSSLIFVLEFLVYPGYPMLSDFLFMYRAWIIFAYAQTL